MTPFYNFQKVADLIGRKFTFTQDQKDAVEIALDVLNTYLMYSYRDNSKTSFTLISRIDDIGLHTLLSDLEIVITTKEYARQPEPKTKKFLERVTDAFKPKGSNDGQ